MPRILGICEELAISIYMLYIFQEYTLNSIKKHIHHISTFDIFYPNYQRFYLLLWMSTTLHLLHMELNLYLLCLLLVLNQRE
jgi:hypothetical protein